MFEEFQGASEGNTFNLFFCPLYSSLQVCMGGWANSGPLSSLAHSFITYKGVRLLSS